MCRIAGMISGQLNSAEMSSRVTIMCNGMKHGGPDGWGVTPVNEANLVFGHRRLAIIDLSNHGHQPMADANNKAIITFNGEIYNYLALKTELIKAGAVFNSNTDTEVILQAYLQWGTAAFSKLRGMFAFALFDSAKALTYLVRDSAGIKPLYYHIAKEQLSFASEVTALNLAGIATVENQKWLVKFLAFGQVPEPETTLNEVYNLPKGHILCWDHHNSQHTIKPYTVGTFGSPITNMVAARETLRHTLEMAVDRQLSADAPIGVFLSGGIDSSLLTLLAHKLSKKEIKTVSIYFEEKAYDESAYQQQIFDKIKGEKFIHLVRQQDFETHFPDILNAMDMPTTDGVNTWFISKYARQDGLKAVLSGIGGDELFGGYPSFKRIRYIDYLRSLPAGLLKLVSDLAPDRYKKAAFLSQTHPLADYLFLRGLFVPADIAQILNCDESQVYDILFSSNHALNPGLSNEEKAAWFETNLYMQNQLLRDTDVMSMSHGLEVRVPFLDEDFQSVVNNIAPALKFNKQQPKKLLVDAFNDLLPSSIWDRPKMGFSFPLQQWMQHNADITNESLYRNTKAKNIIKDFKADHIHWSKAFALYQLRKHV